MTAAVDGGEKLTGIITDGDLRAAHPAGGRLRHRRSVATMVKGPRFSALARGCSR